MQISILISYFTQNPGISGTLFPNSGPFWDTGTGSKNQDHPGKIGTSGKLSQWLQLNLLTLSHAWVGYVKSVDTFTATHTSKTRNYNSWMVMTRSCALMPKWMFISSQLPKWTYATGYTLTFWPWDMPGLVMSSPLTLFRQPTHLKPGINNIVC